jgi:hypothetical protein
MKRVYTNSSDLIHLFAQQSQDDARCSNMFFNKTKIYSYGYHYLLGEFIDSNTLYINDSGYSVTTSKHISQLRYGANQYKQFLNSECDLLTVYNSVKFNVGKLARANKPALYINPIIYLFGKLNEYLKYTKGLTAAKKTKEYKYILSVINSLENNSDDFKANLLLASNVAKKKQAAKDKKDIKMALIKFNTYKSNSFRIGNYDYLRISHDGLKVETSQGVKIDVKECKLLYKMIVAKKDIRGYRIGYYNVTSINGTLKIGCHNINIDSVHSVGAKL